MNNYQIFFAILGAVLYLVGFVPYVYHIFHGRVVPHAFSWTVWTILWGINTYILIGWGMLDVSSVTPIVRTISLSIGAVIGWFLISRVHITRVDIVAIVLGALCLGIAYIYGAHNAIIPTILVDILILIPTLRKIHDDPDTEDALTWLLVMFSHAATLLSLPTHTLENSLFWAYVMCMNLLVATYITYRKKVFHSWKYLFVRIKRRLR
jgi:hypothetical protein